MIHKCPYCILSLVPFVFVLTDIEIKGKRYSAERLKYIKDTNGYSWTCPKCHRRYYSEIEKKYGDSLTYTEKKEVLRKNGGKG